MNQRISQRDACQFLGSILNRPPLHPSTIWRYRTRGIAIHGTTRRRVLNHVLAFDGRPQYELAELRAFAGCDANHTDVVSLPGPPGQGLRTLAGDLEASD